MGQRRQGLAIERSLVLRQGRGRAYQRAARNARRADTALALAISESGASLASVPLQRLADALESATDRRAAMASAVLGTR